MALNSFRNRRRNAIPEYGRLKFARIKDGWEIRFFPSPEIVNRVHVEEPGYTAPAKGIPLVQAHVKFGVLDIWPLNTTALAHGPFRPKYRFPRLLRFEGLRSIEADDLDAARGVLGHLPQGFVRSPEAGLGLDYELRAITETLEERSIDALVVRSGRRDGLPSFDEHGNLEIAKVQFDELRRAIRRVHGKALDLAGEEKDRLAFNELLSKADPVTYEERPPIYRKDGVVAVIGSRSADQLSTADQNAVVTAAQKAVRPLVKRKPAAMLQLSQDIELVTLETLIDEMKKRLDRDKSERPWQKFFDKNSFILRLAFGYPVVQMGGQISVGGTRFDGGGEKIPDFVVKAAATGNLALVEIKAADAQLFVKRVYRGGVYAPDVELAGGVNQLLDQRHKLQTHFAAKKVESRLYDVEAYAVEGILVIGRTPDDPNQQKSLELFRHGLKSILVLTYDELLMKLENLRDFLRPPSAQDGS